MWLYCELRQYLQDNVTMSEELPALIQDYMISGDDDSKTVLLSKTKLGFLYGLNLSDGTTDRRNRSIVIQLKSSKGKQNKTISSLAKHLRGFGIHCVVHTSTCSTILITDWNESCIESITKESCVSVPLEQRQS